MRITFVSNGHGEDAIGARLAVELWRIDPSLRLSAYPLVSDGAPYERAAVTVLGPRRALPSGGLMLHSWSNLRADLGAGFVGLTLRQAGDLMRLRSDAVIVVGDLYAQALAALARARARFVVQPLVSLRHAQGGGRREARRYFMERIAYPERALMRHLAERVYVRDEPTARFLRSHGVGAARSLGNPMIDMAAGAGLDEARAAAGAAPVVACLPGTRAYAAIALERMAAALARIGPVLGVVAWTGGALPPLRGWEVVPAPSRVPGLTAALRRGSSQLWLLEGRFGDVLASADLALGTAGTGNEQAAGLGLPVVSFPLEPHYTRAFLDNQRRLLGPALRVVADDPGAVAAALAELAGDAAMRRRVGAEGRRRMGPGGGSSAIASDVVARLRALRLLA